MSGRINPIPLKDALAQATTLYLVQAASPPQRVETIQDKDKADPPFQFELNIERYLFLEEWVLKDKSTTICSGLKAPTSGEIIEVASVEDLLRLRVSRRYHYEGVRKIPIYDRLDVHQAPKDNDKALLIVDGYDARMKLYKILGAAPIDLINSEQFQSKP